MNRFKYFLIGMCVLALLSREAISTLTEIRIPVRESTGFYPIKKFEPDRPRLVLALSGGGVRGLAHLGVLKALDEAGIKIDGIAGVSSGSLIGGLYAGGFSPTEIEDRLHSIDWESVMLDQPDRRTLLLSRKQEFSRHLLEFRLGKGFSTILPGAISPGQRLHLRLLETTLDLPYRFVHDWNQLPVPLQILATDLQTGQPVIFNSGDLAVAMRGSMAIPLLFDPVSLEGMQIIDGGISSNIPVELARSMGGEVVLAVDVSADLRPGKPPYLPWQIVDRVTTILEQEFKNRSVNQADFYLKPNIVDSLMEGALDRSYAQAGYQAMKENLGQLKSLLSIRTEPQDSTVLTIKVLNIPEPISNQLPFPLNPSLPQVSIREIKIFLADCYRIGTVRQAQASYNDQDSSLTVDIEWTPVINEFAVKSAFNSQSPDTFFSDRIGKILNFSESRTMLEKVLKEDRKAGLCQSGIRDFTFHPEDGSLQLDLESGQLSGVRFKGLDRINERTLRRELSFTPGEILHRDFILKSVSSLYATGLFRSVIPEIRPAANQEHGYEIVYHMIEQSAPTVRLGLAYQAQQRTRGFAELSMSSPINYKARLIFFTAVGELDDEVRVSFLFDRGSGLSAMSNLTIGYSETKRIPYDYRHHKIDLEAYTEARWGGSFEVGGQVLSWGLLSLTSRWERHKNRYYDQNRDYNLAAVGVRLGLDNLDRDPYPNNGVRLAAAFEGSGNFLPSEVKFNKFTSQFESYLEPIPRYTLGFRFLGRTADRTTPRDEQFRLGGIHEFPGLNLDEETGIVQLVGGLELRIDLLSRMLSDSYLGFRLDAAGSWEDPAAQIDRRDWLPSAAIYFALDTILGPIHLQWGHLFPNQNNRSQNIFFLQVGNLF